MKPAVLIAFIVVLLAAWLPASGQDTPLETAQAWSPDQTSLIEQPPGGLDPPPLSSREPAGQVHLQAKAVTARPQRLGWPSVPGEIHRTYLPLAPHNVPLDLICQGQGTVTLWLGWSDREAPAMEQILANWSARCPTIEVDLRYLPYGDLKEEYIAATAAGVGPDLLIAHGDWLSDLVESGSLKPLDALPLNVSRYIPASVEALRFRGQLYGIPQSVETVAMLYNKELISTPPSTLEELLAAAANQGGLAMNYGFYHAFWGIPAHGGALFDDNEWCILDQDGFAEWLDWLAAHQNDPGVTLGLEYEQLFDLFREGNATLYPDGPWALSRLEPDVYVNVGVAPLPAGPAGPAGPLLTAKGVMFSSAADDHQTWLGLQFARYLTGMEAQQILMSQAGLIPANTRVVPANELIAGFLAQARTASPFPTTPRMNAVWVPGQEAYAKVLQGIMSGQEAAVEACAAINSAPVQSSSHRGP